MHEGVGDRVAWSEVFRARVARPLPAVDPPPLGVAARAALAASLARFQRGEAGEGRIAREVRALPIADELKEAIGLFVKEEGRHARILARAVAALGGTLVHAHWSDRLFVLARRGLGASRGVAAFERKLAVLLAAEVVGGAYYGLVCARLPPSALAEALAQIARDEDDHLRFHLEVLRGARAGRVLALAASTCGAGLVWLDHRSAFAALGISFATWVRAVGAGMARVWDGG